MRRRMHARMYKPQMHTHKQKGGGGYPPQKRARIHERTTGANTETKRENNLQLITNLLQSVRTLSHVGRQLQMVQVRAF
jgi:hypothetical protein